ncbi:MULTISPECIES: hypothetical protein [unclassified Flavobacterium]|uniref:hypothetical protein n=1 Tax=unclassified Flavobacterium TaxID=196869 RepID=UPI000F0C76F5|nr:MULTISPECIES: hypothetical protein [unclassified Flavobacterium]AYN02873.1 hypothetical protein EAG11_00815 [Flavobacterium sp. 140616W15]MCD0473093.1 hypothetical protein [Flavobacterium sp. EDS]
MKKLLYLLVFCPFLGFSQNDPNYAVDCDANDIIKEIYYQDGYTVMKCTDANGNYVLNVIGVAPGSGGSNGGGSGGGNGSGGPGVDTGMSEDPGPEDSGPGRTCINTWVRDNNAWQQTVYCGG